MVDIKIYILKNCAHQNIQQTVANTIGTLCHSICSVLTYRTSLPSKFHKLYTSMNEELFIAHILNYFVYFCEHGYFVCLYVCHSV